MRRVRLCSMNETVMRTLLRRVIPAALVFATCATAANAQPPLPPPASQRNPVCVRLESQLAMVDRGGQVDPQRAEQIRRYEENAQRQQAELDRVTAQARRMGCEGRGFFSLFGGQPQQCGPLNNQVQQMRANLDRILADLQRLQGNTADREGERRTILASLAQNECGPQYRQYANRGGGGFFENLFGGGTIITPGTPSGGSGDTYRTVCVRTCDGYYFPISYSTTPASFPQDEQTCQRMCPAAEVALYSHRNPGEDVSQALSTSGRSYTELPNAFAFRKAFNPSCSCRAPGQTWSQALKHLDDDTIEQGDIVVTEEQSKLLSQPADQRGKGAAKKGAQPKGAAQAPVKSTPAATQPKQKKASDGKPHVRTVGPPFIPSN
jgi:hypothetical protein